MAIQKHMVKIEMDSFQWSTIVMQEGDVRTNWRGRVYEGRQGGWQSL